MFTQSGNVYTFTFDQDVSAFNVQVTMLFTDVNTKRFLAPYITKTTNIITVTLDLIDPTVTSLVSPGTNAFGILITQN